MDAAIKSKRALYKTYMSLKKQGDTPGVAKAKADYDIAKRHAKHKVWFSKQAASVETFKAVDPHGSNIYRIARQMTRENQDIVGENCFKNDAGQLSLTDEDKMKAWVERYSKVLNVEFTWPKDTTP